jgi:hypothetical protein
MFQVKATVLGFAGDEEKYPCHFQHKIGDTFIYDGEKNTGRICPGLSAAVVPRMMEFFAAGPRPVPRPQYYYAFWYAPVSRRDENKKKFDGIGFCNVLRTEAEPPNSIASLQPAHAFVWPPVNERIVALTAALLPAVIPELPSELRFGVLAPDRLSVSECLNSEAELPF